jgi:hypothetical protein
MSVNNVIISQSKRKWIYSNSYVNGAGVVDYTCIRI